MAKTFEELHRLATEREKRNARGETVPVHGSEAVHAQSILMDWIAANVGPEQRAAIAVVISQALDL